MFIHVSQPSHLSCRRPATRGPDRDRDKWVFKLQCREGDFRNKKLSVARRSRAELVGGPSLGSRQDPTPTPTPRGPGSAARPHAGALPWASRAKGLSGVNFRGRVPRLLARAGRHLVRTSAWDHPPGPGPRGASGGRPGGPRGLGAPSLNAARVDPVAAGSVRYDRGRHCGQGRARGRASTRSTEQAVPLRTEPRRLRKEARGSPAGC